MEAKVELYNLCRGGRAVGNGWYVAKYEGSRRMGTLADFKADESSARKFAAEWNDGGTGRSPTATGFARKSKPRAEARTIARIAKEG